MPTNTSTRVAQTAARALPAILATLCGLAWSSTAAATDYYSPGGWPTLHMDAGNRRSVDAAVTANRYAAWDALDGASVLTSPVTSPDGSTLYVTTGLPRGHSNLYAFSIDGTERWRSEPWTDEDTGVDPCAILSSPIVDNAGDVYINDCNQLFAFRADGSSKWVVALPPTREGDWAAAGEHPVNAFTTAAFTREGDLVGITNFGDLVVVDRETGRQLNAAYRLPAELAPYSRKHALPDSLLGGELVDPMIREWIWQLIFGGNMRSANTPAVSRSGRVFVVGSSDEPGIGALFGLDIDTAATPYTISAAFITKIGIGSGSSPALSPSEHQVYVSDEDGWLYAIDSVSGAITWKVQTAAAAGAAAVGEDGTVYALQEYPAPAIVAVSPKGNILWQSDTTSLLDAMPSSLLLGDAATVASGNPAVTRDAVLVPVNFSYPVPFTSITIPTRAAVIALDRNTGKALKEVVSLKDDSSGITAVLPDGTLVNSIGSVVSSATGPLKPLSDLVLPESLLQMEATGGIQVSRPVK